jgi:excinuclease UvrABC nuclease subunit
MIFHFVELTQYDIPFKTRNRKSMEKAAKNLDFRQAAKLRDDIKALQEQLA